MVIDLKLPQHVHHVQREHIQLEVQPRVRFVPLERIPGLVRVRVQPVQLELIRLHPVQLPARIVRMEHIHQQSAQHLARLV
jgi:hypothetical protein